MATPKKPRKDSEGPSAALGLSPATSTPSPGVVAQQQQQQQQWGPPQQQQQQPSLTAPHEAGGSNEEALARGRGGEAVTDAAHAFRELRVRAPRAGSPRRAAAVTDGPASGREAPTPPERPSSPKKRKASYNIDKEFILKDDKVKRNAGTQGDISQARGQLGQLLFEFSQIELNRDLLEAIKRTESKTGRSSGRPPAPPGRMDRAAFELAVGDAAELLQAQLSSVEAHCEDAALRGAILRTYAVQAIAAFADEDSDSEESGAGVAGGSSSSDDENADSNSRRQQRGCGGGSSASLDGPPRAALSGDTGSQVLDELPRPESAAGCHSPQHLPAQQQGQQQAAALQQRAPQPGGMAASPSRSLPDGSAAGQGQTSSSFLPDALPDSALEDTASAGGPRAARQQQQREQQQADGQREGSAAPAATPGAGASRFAWQQQQLEQAADEGLQRMRMLSLEAEGSAQQEEGDEDGPQDMVRSPAPVTSRRMPVAPAVCLGPADAGAQHGQQGGRGQCGPSSGGARRTAAAASGARVAAVLEGARQMALGTRSPHQQQQGQQQGHGHQQQQGQQHQHQQHRRPQAEEQHQHRRPQPEEQQQESSEGHSTGQASSAARDPPKRQRRSGDLLPPLFEHSSQQRRQQQLAAFAASAAAAVQESDSRAAAAAAAVAAAAAAAQRAAILGSLRPRPTVSRQQQQQQQQQGEGSKQALAPAGPSAEALEAGAASDAGDNAPGPQQQQQQQQAEEGEAEGPGAAAAAAGREASHATLRAARAAHSGSSVWGSTLVCADLTVNDVASQYWPFLRSAMRGQTATLQAGDKALVETMVVQLGDAISDAYTAEAGSMRRPPAEVKSLVAATAFDDFFRAKTAADSSGASLG